MLLIAWMVSIACKHSLISIVNACNYSVKMHWQRSILKSANIPPELQ